MKQFLSGIVALAALGTAAPVIAADLSAKSPIYAEVPAAHSWAGFYLGAHAGLASGSTAFADIVNPATNTAYETVDGSDRFKASRTGFIGGAQAGYNWQVDHFVFGVEADLGYLGGDARRFSISAPDDVAGDVRGGLYGTVRGRLGFAADRALFFVTGGVIGVDDGARVTDQLSPTTLYTNRAGFRGGWTAGGGIELAVNKNWSVKVDYLYYDLGNKTVTGELISNGTPSGDFYSWRAGSTGNIGRVGLNYHF